MPLIKLQFRPGVNRDQTNYTGEGGWWDINRVRFFSGYPQKIGGWKRYTVNTITGTCRQLWGWVTTFSDNFLALGTNEKVYIESGGIFNDITPLLQTSTAGVTTFSAVNGSSVITVTDTTLPVTSVGSYVTFSGVTALGLGGNITQAVLQQNYKINSIISGTQYTIIAKSNTTGLPVVANASDTGNGGAAVVSAYEIPIGNASLVYGYGWGAGGWSRGGWGSGTSQPILTPQRDWWFDNFDNDLVSNIRNGAIYYWERGALTNPAISLAVRARTLSSFATTYGRDPNAVPVRAMQVLVSQNDKHLIAFGAVPFGSTNVADFDPMLIRWASQDDPFQWAPTALNSAGDLRVSRGSRIVRALPTRQEILVWTDSSLYSLQFLGTTDVFSLQEYADNISVMSPRAVASASNITYWMGADKFYAYSGRIETLPCTVREYVFGDLNYDQSDQIVCGTNEGFNEVWWFYPSANSATNNRYVVFNHLERVWYYGEMSRTAWLDSPLRKKPQAVATNVTTQIGTIYNHEDGVDDDTAAMTCFIQSNDIDLEDGDKFVLTKRVIPDIHFIGSESVSPQVTMKVRSRNFPGADLSNGDDTANVVATSVEVFTQQVFIRTRARQLALRVESDAIGTQWQLGTPRVDGRTDGAR
jgi:hypothetical protein